MVAVGQRLGRGIVVGNEIAAHQTGDLLAVFGGDGHLHPHLAIGHVPLPAQPEQGIALRHQRAVADLFRRRGIAAVLGFLEIGHRGLAAAIAHLVEQPAIALGRIDGLEHEEIGAELDLAPRILRRQIEIDDALVDRQVWGRARNRPCRPVFRKAPAGPNALPLRTGSRRSMRNFTTCACASTAKTETRSAPAPSHLKIMSPPNTENGRDDSPSRRFRKGPISPGPASQGAYPPRRTVIGFSQIRGGPAAGTRRGPGRDGRAGTSLRQMRLAADSADDAAVFHQHHRPGECRLRRPDHEQGPGLHARHLWLRRGRLLPRLCALPGPRQRDPGAGRRAALDILHPAGLGRAVRGQCVGVGCRTAFTRSAFFWAWSKPDSFPA